MAQFLSILEHPVPAKGLNKQAFPLEKRLQQHFFPDEYRNFSLLEKLSPLTITVAIPVAIPRLFYPGCGADILSPLIYVEKLFPQTQQWEFLFVDIEDTFGLIKTILDDVGIPFEENSEEDLPQLQFYWKKTLICLHFRQQNISTLSQPEFHLYFERAFAIFKSQIPHYDQKVVHALPPGGIIISDSGFQNCNLDRIPAPSQLSSYGEMVIARKPTATNLSNS